MLDIFIYFFQRVEENHQRSKEGNDITTSCTLCKDFWVLHEEVIDEDSQWMWGNCVGGLFR